MARPIGEDENSITFENDDGTTFRSAKVGVNPSLLAFQQAAPATPLAGGNVSSGAPLAPLALPTEAQTASSMQRNLDPDLATLSPDPGPAPEPTPAPAPASLPQSTSASPNMLLSGMGKQKKAADMMADTVVEQAKNEARAYDAFNSENARIEQERATKIAERQKAVQDRVAQVEKNNAELAKAEPKDFWADRSTGARVAAALMVGLGQYSAAKTGGPNSAMTILNQAIDNDLKLQIEKRNSVKEQGQQRLGALDFYVNSLGDEVSAIEATRAAAYKKAMVQVDRAASLAKGDQAKANALAMKGQLEQKYGEIMGTLAAKQAEAMDKNLERFVPGMGQLATTKEGAAKLNAMVADVGTAKSGINSLVGMIGTSGKSFSPEKRAEAQAIATMLKGSLRTLLIGPGAVTENEQKLLDSIVADPTRIFSLDSSSKKSLQTLQNRLDVQLATNAKAYGLVPKSSNIKETPR